MKNGSGQKPAGRGLRIAAVTFAACAGLLMLGSGNAFALGKPYLVKDINPSGDSNPALIANVNREVFFAANDGIRGEELWKSDGTQSGTALVKDINPGGAGSNIHNLIIGNQTGPAVAGGDVYFSADDGVHGPELWKSDGTEAGTVLVRDIEAGSDGARPAAITTFAGQVFFIASDGNQPLAHGTELWKTDGTAAGTVMVKDIDPGPPSAIDYMYPKLTPYGEYLFFAADDGSHGHELWKTDGTEAGTTLVKDIVPGGEGSVPDELTSVFGTLSASSTLFFSTDVPGSGQELWKSDGTAGGTVLVKDLPEGGPFTLRPNAFINASGRFFFAAPSYDGEIGHEPWTSDGTEAGTHVVKDISPGSFGSLSDAETAIFPIGGSVLLDAADVFNPDLTGNYELWRSDGTEAGTVLVKDIRSGTAGSVPAAVGTVGGFVLFTAYESDALGRRLWQTDLTESGTTLVASIPDHVDSVRPVDDRVFLSGRDSVHGEELWASSTLPPAELVVLKRCVPTGDAGLFRFSVYRLGESEALDSAIVVCGDSHTFELPDTGDYDVVETAGDASTSLGSYSTSVGGNCSLVDDDADFRDAVVSLVNDQIRSCSFTNTNETVKSSLVVAKVCSAKAHDGDRFQVILNEAAADDPLDCGGTVTLTLEPDTAYAVTEAAAGTTNLTDYDVSYTDCSGSGIARGDTATCTITNTLKPRPVLTVMKACPNGKQSLGDLFGVVLNGTATGDVLACGGSVPLTLEPGATYTVSEGAASTTTNLLNYSVGYAGCQGTGLARGASATCTITNTRLAPRNQPRSPGYWKNHQAQLSALLPVIIGSYSVPTVSTATAVFAAMNCSSTKDANVAGCLGGHLLAAKLNVKNGADNCINSVIASADGLLVAVGYAGPSAPLARSFTSTERSSAVQLKNALDEYNNGKGC